MIWHVYQVSPASDQRPHCRTRCHHSEGHAELHCVCVTQVMCSYFNGSLKSG